MQVILIPVYKTQLNVNEIISLSQCCKILRGYDIVLVIPKNLDTKQYDLIATKNHVKLRVEFFDESFFLNISSYNRLLLCRKFYERFSNYKYMLIYQLDAYVFNDSLEEWCLLGYDYIGAPIIGKHHEYIFDRNTYRIGNGGLSLRNIHSFINCFHNHENLFSFTNSIKLYKNSSKNIFFKTVLLPILMTFGIRNNFNFFNKKWHYNEDDFWSNLLNNSNLKLKTPPFEIAIQFSFERFPSELFQINDMKLPFGCHAWDKYEYETFWSKYIR